MFEEFQKFRSLRLPPGIGRSEQQQVNVERTVESIHIHLSASGKARVIESQIFQDWLFGFTQLIVDHIQQRIAILRRDTQKIHQQIQRYQLTAKSCQPQQFLQMRRTLKQRRQGPK